MKYKYPRDLIRLRLWLVRPGAGTIEMYPGIYITHQREVGGYKKSTIAYKEGGVKESNWAFDILKNDTYDPDLKSFYEIVIHLRVGKGGVHPPRIFLVIAPSIWKKLRGKGWKEEKLEVIEWRKLAKMWHFYNQGE